MRSDSLQARLVEGVAHYNYFHNILNTLKYTVSYRFWIETFPFCQYFLWLLAVDNCNDSPCLNNGTCKHLQDGFSCDCAEGFTGLICQGDSVTICFQL